MNFLGIKGSVQKIVGNARSTREAKKFLGKQAEIKSWMERNSKTRQWLIGRAKEYDLMILLSSRENLVNVERNIRENDLPKFIRIFLLERISAIKKLYKKLSRLDTVDPQRCPFLYDEFKGIIPRNIVALMLEEEREKRRLAK